MKTKLLTTLLIFVSLITLAQNHITQKVNLTNSTWTIYNPEYPTEVSTIGTFEKDTLLPDGFTYLVMFHSSTNNLNENSTFWGGIRFDSIENRIYRNDMRDSAKILFDFSLAVGDTLTYNKGYLLVLSAYESQFPMIIESIDSITTFDGVVRRRFSFLGGSNKIVEGIGIVNRYPFAIMNLFTTGHPAILGCYKQADDCLFTITTCEKCYGDYVGVNYIGKENQFQFIYPNPVNNTLYIKPDAANVTEITIYNINGQFMLRQKFDGFNNGIDVSELKQGIYYCELQATNGEVWRNRFMKE